MISGKGQSNMRQYLGLSHGYYSALATTLRWLPASLVVAAAVTVLSAMMVFEHHDPSFAATTQTIKQVVPDSGTTGMKYRVLVSGGSRLKFDDPVFVGDRPTVWCVAGLRCQQFPPNQHPLVPSLLVGLGTVVLIELLGLRLGYLRLVAELKKKPALRLAA